MSDRKRFNTPNHNPNASMFVRKNSATKRFLPNVTGRPQSNDTVCGVSGEPIIKTSLTPGILRSQLIEVECDLAYNNYLQALMKNKILETQIVEKENILQGQILFQEENEKKNKDVLKQIQKDTELLMKKEEIVKMIYALEENINTIQQMYGINQVKRHAGNIKSALENKSDTLILRNIESIDSQEHDRLIESLNKLACASDKIIKSGQDFEGIHRLAEECRHLLKLIKRVKDSQALLSSMETHTIYTVLQQLSDQFAKQYENME